LGDSGRPALGAVVRTLGHRSQPFPRNHASVRRRNED
jgi:hypothetical protein